MKALKKSYYTIAIPLNNSAEEYFLIHGYTGAINIVPKVVGIVLSQEEPDILHWNCSAEILQQLIQRGFITTKTSNEEINLANKIANAVHLYQNITSVNFYRKIKS